MDHALHGAIPALYGVFQLRAEIGQGYELGEGQQGLLGLSVAGAESFLGDVQDLLFVLVQDRADDFQRRLSLTAFVVSTEESGNVGGPSH